MKTTKTTCTRETQKAYTARTGKGKQKRLQAKGGQRGTSDSAERVWGVRPKDNISPCPIGHLPFQGRQKTPLPCRASRTERSLLSPTVTFPHPVGNHLYRGDNLIKPPLLEEVARSAVGVRGVSGEPCSPLRCAFSDDTETICVASHEKTHLKNEMRFLWDRVY